MIDIRIGIVNYPKDLRSVRLRKSPVPKIGEGNVLLSVQAAGVWASLQTALDIVRPAGQITKAGSGPKPLNCSLDSLVQNGITLQGSFSHNWPMWEKMISSLAGGKINLDPVPNRWSPLGEWRESFEEMRSGQIAEGVLTG